MPDQRPDEKGQDRKKRLRLLFLSTLATGIAALAFYAFALYSFIRTWEPTLISLRMPLPGNTLFVCICFLLISNSSFLMSLPADATMQWFRHATPLHAPSFCNAPCAFQQLYNRHSLYIGALKKLFCLSAQQTVDSSCTPYQT